MNHYFLRQDVWEQVTLPRIVEVIKKRKLQIGEIQVSMRCLSGEYIKNLVDLIQIISPSLKSLSINQSSEKSDVEIGSLQSIFTPNIKNVKIQIKDGRFFENPELEIIKSERISIKSNKDWKNQPVIEYLKYLEPKKAILIHISNASIEEYLEYFRALEDSDHIKRRVIKILKMNSYAETKPLVKNDQELMKDLNIFLLGHYNDSINNIAINRANAHFPQEVSEYLNSFEYTQRNKKTEEAVHKDISLEDICGIVKQNWLATYETVKISLSECSFIQSQQPQSTLLFDLLKELGSLEEGIMITSVEIEQIFSKQNVSIFVTIGLLQQTQNIKVIKFEAIKTQQKYLQLQWTHEFIEALPILDHLETLQISCRSDSYLCMRNAVQFTHHLLQLKGSRIKKLSAQFRMVTEIKKNKQDLVIYEEIKEGFAEIKMALVTHCNRLEEIFLHTFKLPQIVPMLIFLSRDSNMPNLKVINVAMSTADFVSVATSLLKVPTSKISPTLQSINIRQMPRINIGDYGKTFKALLTAVLAHLNHRITIEMQEVFGYDINDLDELSQLVTLFEPLIVINARVHQYDVLQANQQLMYTFKKVADIIELISGKHPIE
ncbi:hypothetical protein FGO68_gene14011 [Halteria grandinella]|uniref:Uncharacterized protein n=1 Tax=Halteria grandinella TaxID=5974 RepID=A0A8J8T4V9_HALGN|nr:hypothetical protein FGO68_gene14011 [Halteria grandinella]